MARFSNSTRSSSRPAPASVFERTCSEEYEVVTSFVDLLDPKPAGVVAFAVRDNLLVPLRARGWQPAVETRQAGEIFGGKASPREPLPVEIY